MLYYLCNSFHKFTRNRLVLHVKLAAILPFTRAITCYKPKRKKLMAAQRSLFEFYDSHKNPSQGDLANAKRKRLDEDIIDLNSERDGRRT